MMVKNLQITFFFPVFILVFVSIISSIIYTGLAICQSYIIPFTPHNSRRQIKWSCIICEWGKKKARNINSHLMAYLIYYKIVFCIRAILQCTLLYALLYIYKHLGCIIVYNCKYVHKTKSNLFMGDLKFSKQQH